MPVGDLRPHPENPRNGNLEAIEASIAANGFFGSVVAQEGTGLVIVGNHRLRAAVAKGAKKIPVIFVACTDLEAERFASADNKTHDDGEGYDAELQLAQLRRISEAQDGSLEGTGFDAVEYAQLEALAAAAISANEEVDTDRSDSAEKDDGGDETDDEMHTTDEPITQFGDIIIMGEHRVMCGDAFVLSNRRELFGRHRMALAVMDPPYAIYGSSTGIGADIADDKMIQPFFVDLCRMISKTANDFSHVYLCCDWRSYPTIAAAAKGARLSAKNLIVWNKGGGLGASYANCYELVAFFAKLPPPTAMKSTSQRGQRTVMAPNLITMNRVSSKEREHNAAKPIPLFEWLIGNSSDPGDLVADFFLGSGTTVLAAEKTGRRCFGFELEPRYADLIVRRWEKMTGKTARRIPQSERKPIEVVRDEPEEESQDAVDTTP